MSTSIPNYYWDTCVFVAHFNDERGQHGNFVDHIQQFLDEAASGKCKIYCSTITIAEISRSSLTAVNVGSFIDFLRDFQSAVTMIDPNPVLMGIASELRSQQYIKQGFPRRLGTPDAIHLATAIGLKDLFGVEIDAFHTFDRGTQKGQDGYKGMPLIGFETWCDHCHTETVVQQVISLTREKPQHPSPKLGV